MKSMFSGAALGVLCVLLLSGCEDDSDTVVNEAPTIITGSNSSVIVVSDNSGLVSVDQTTTGESDPNIYIEGNTGRVYVVTRPQEPPDVSE